MSVSEEDSSSNNRAALKKFYEKKDPFRVKNIDSLFLRYEDADILWAVESKYKEPVVGWVAVDPTMSEPSASPSLARNSVRDSGMFAGMSYEMCWLHRR
jgi:hypothetical protein